MRQKLFLASFVLLVYPNSTNLFPAPVTFSNLSGNVTP